MFHTVLVANRGEISVRVIRTLRAMGIRSVAVYSDADAGARHVHEADLAIRLGPTPAGHSGLTAGSASGGLTAGSASGGLTAGSASGGLTAGSAGGYLSIQGILDAAARTGAQAVHPGYGFLSENAAFARACTQAGLVFIGPPADSIEAMGDKIRAKQTVAAAGVPVVPGNHTQGLDDDGLAVAAGTIGYPVLLKPSAGGGGKGMRVVYREPELAEAIASARREAKAAFGDATLFVERLVTTSRHIEIQILADAHGGAIHLGERECSLQRRHQKIVEEAPSTLLDAATRERMGSAAVAVAQAVGYTGVGTVEFLVPADAPDQFFFLEMNTRLQVEHPVTELVTGLDLVELQLRVAAGESLPLRQDDVCLNGHAVQARIYAEDPSRGFLPTGGQIRHLNEPAGPGIRVDSGLVAGGTVGSDYDPLLAKIIAYGPDRDTALRRLDGALARTSILGVGTNTGFLRALLADADVRAGRLDTGLVERGIESWVGGELPDDVPAAAGVLALLALEPTGPVVDPFAIPGGWRVGEPAWTRWQLLATDLIEVRTRGRAAAAEVAVGKGAPVAASASWHGEDLIVTLDGVTHQYAFARDGATVWLGRDGHSWMLRELETTRRAGSDVAGAGPVRAPMPGTVTVVDVAEGQQVTAGARLLVVEAMKMEHALTAPIDGVVRYLRARPGSTVERDAVLLTLVSA